MGARLAGNAGQVGRNAGKVSKNAC